MNNLKLKEAIDAYLEYSKTEDFRRDTEDREERKKFFAQLFKKQLDEFSFSEIIKKLWASQIWSNKEYLVDKIIKKNTFEKVKAEFDLLLDKKVDVGARYERFLNNISGIGPSMLTEILCYYEPEKAGIWNDKARKAFSWLEADDIPYNKYQISAEEYNKFNGVLNEIGKELEKQGFDCSDLLLVDYFLWEIWGKFIKGKDEVIEKKITSKISGNQSRHDELRDKLEAIGNGLGFKVETEKLIATGSKVDCVWRASIANLGSVSYVFEVQDRGSVDSLIVNLNKAQKNPTVQKLLVVSDEEQIEKIKKEIDDMSHDFKNTVVYWSSGDVDNTYKNLGEVTASIAKLNLLGDKFAAEERED